MFGHFRGQLLRRRLEVLVRHRFTDDTRLAELLLILCEEFVYDLIGASLSEPHCYLANRGKRNALWCVRTRNFSTVIKIPSACDRNCYQFVVNLPIVFPSSQLLRQFAWLRISQDASHFARRNLLAELVEQ